MDAATMNDNDTPDYVMYAMTSDATVMKTLFDAIKDLIIDTTLEFDRDGVKFISLDNTHVVMVHLKLEADKFDEYLCTEPVSIGINLSNFNKLLKSVTSTDKLGLFLEDSNRSTLGVRIYNEEQKRKTMFQMNTLDIDTDEIEVPPLQPDVRFMLPSSDFQKIVRDMYNIAERVELKAVKNKLYMACKGDFCTQETELEESDYHYREDSRNKIVQGVFSIKHLNLFCKCSSLCSFVDINLTNNFPLIIEYAVANLGHLKLCLSPTFVEPDED